MPHPSHDRPDHDMEGFSTPQLIVLAILVLTLVSLFSRSWNIHDISSTGARRRGGASLEEDRLVGTGSEINVPLAYREAAMRNQGQVRPGSEAARVAQDAATPEVRALYQEECRNGGFTRKGSLAARTMAEESRRMRPRPGASGANNGQ